MSVQPLFEDPLRFEENDIASLACFAAMELDELTLGRQSELKSVRRLAEKISLSIKPGIHNPAALVLIAGSIHDARWPSDPPKKLEDLVIQAGEIAGRMLSLAESGPLSAPPSDLAPMRLFCVSLSKRALTASRTRPSARHPISGRRGQVHQPKGGTILESLDAIWEAGLKEWEKIDDPDAYLQEVRGEE